MSCVGFSTGYLLKRTLDLLAWTSNCNEFIFCRQSQFNANTTSGITFETGIH